MPVSDAGVYTVVASQARASGCRTFAEIRSRSKDVKGPRFPERTSAQLIGKWKRCHPELSEELVHRTSVPELSEREKSFCTEVGFSPWQFAILRDRLLREAEESGGRFSKILVRSFFRLDTSQAVKLFDFFVAEKRIVNSDRDLMRDPKKSCP